MKKINKLTPAQELLVPIYRDKWLANGRKTTRLDRAGAIAAINTIYKCAGQDGPKHFFFFPSPIQCQLAANILKQTDLKKIMGGANLRANLGANLRDNLWANLWANLGDNLRANLGDNLRANLGDNLGDNLRDNLRDNLWANLWANLRANLEANLRDNLRDNLGANLRDNLGANLELKYENIFFGNHWTWWVGFYDFILNELFTSKISEYSSFKEYIEACQNIHLFIPYKDIVFISDNPTVLNINQSGRLHADQMPAMQYSDGYSLFYLNGIKMPKEIVLSEAYQLDAHLILKEKNVEIRRELLRKIGIERICADLNAKVKDKWRDYELLELDLGDGRYRPYLKMINPSIGVNHIEGVHPDCTTVKKALAWRNGMSKFIEPQILT